ncbi:MAG: hypothetical protein ACE5F1_16255 [Planctomycetota bacterium]
MNLTPHPIVVGIIIPPSGQVARISCSYEEQEPVEGYRVFRPVWGEPVGLPAAQDGTYYIVSAIVKAALPERPDLLVPATGHPDARRNKEGQIISVPGFLR